MGNQSEINKLLDRIKARIRRIIEWFHPDAVLRRLTQLPQVAWNWVKQTIGYYFLAMKELGESILPLSRFLLRVLALLIIVIIGSSLWNVFYQPGDCPTKHGPPDQNGRVNLAQCWNAVDRAKFYTTDEGALTIPYDLVKYLELHDSQDPVLSQKNILFLSNENITRYGFLPLEEGDFPEFSPFVDVDGSPSKSPKDWPLGFVLKDVKEGSWKGLWFGITCAACHTGQIEYKDKDGKKLRIRIDGGPAMIDLHWFLNDLHESLRETRLDAVNSNVHYDKAGKEIRGKKRDGEKFKRYAKLNVKKSPGRIYEQLYATEQAHEEWHRWNDPPKDEDNNHVSQHNPPWDYRHGFGRLDAFGSIFNQLLNLAGSTEEAMPPNAPVNYPFLWDTSQHDWTQWNAISPRIPKGRNIGQWIGTFGKFEFPPAVGVVGSIPLDKIRELQKLLDGLRSPIWPDDILGPIDKGGDPYKRGRKFYEKRCEYCHEIQARENPLRKIRVHLADADITGSLGTDPTMTKNANNRSTNDPDGARKIQSILVGTVGYVLGHPSNWFPNPLDPSNMLSNLREGFDTLVEFGGPFVECTEDYIKGVFRWNWQWKRCVRQDDSKIFYKGRPLDGIWATAPYLHNGSVANLYELMLPQDERMKAFCVGSKEFDPEHVGFETLVDRDRSKRDYIKSEKECTSRGLFWLDTKVPGNRNTGHEYGVRWCDKADQACKEKKEQEIEALIAYMKSL